MCIRDSYDRLVVVLENHLLFRGVFYTVLDFVREVFRLEVYQTARVFPGTLEYRRTGSTRRYHPGYECKWATNTVVHIFENREYTGCLVNFKTEKLSYKVKHSVENPPEKDVYKRQTHGRAASTAAPTPLWNISRVKSWRCATGRDFTKSTS